ncbi:MAG: hypothetical protein JJ895_08075 [Balneolaceae bacterium]|nr:hypothetical protein [Balneolaceae bacterium]
MSETDQIDFHKLALKSGYKISDSWSLATKVVVEHAFDQQYNGGDLFFSDAYVKFKHSKKLTLSFGLQSVPIEAAKPGSYGTVEISPVEKYLSHAWRELGVKASGDLNKKLSYQFMVGTGLHAAEIGAKSVIYDARNSSLSSSIQNVAFGGKVVVKPNYSWEFGSSYYFSGLSKSNDTDADLTGANYQFGELFTRFAQGNIESRVVGVYSTIANAEKVNNAFHNKVGSAQYGLLLELGYNFSDQFNIKRDDSHLKGFFRTEFYDPYYRMSGFADKKKYEHIDYSIGVVYQPLKSIEFKADYVIMRSGSAVNEHHFDVSIGFHL